MKSLFNLFAVVAALSAFVHVVGCSGGRVDQNNPQDLINDAEEDIKDKRYVVALDKLKSLKNKFPYSHLATQANLRIADVYFLEEQYIEAAGAYEGFRDLHPRHEKADYVLFRMGESYFNQLPGGEDRDLGPAGKAIDAYKELIALYPKSEHIEQGKKHMSEATELLAQKEKYIADFYYIRDMFDSAAGRYEKITGKFPGTNVEQYAYWRLGQSLIKQNKPDEARRVLESYVAHYPNGQYAKAAGDWLEKK